jgi:hypothetical protein
MLWVGLAAALFAVLLFVVVFAVLPQRMVSGAEAAPAAAA